MANVFDYKADMKVLSTALLPEMILAVTACALFLLGTSTRVLSRKLAGELALLAVVVVFLIQCFRVCSPTILSSYPLALRADAGGGDPRPAILASSSS